MGTDSRLGGRPRTRLNAQVRARTSDPVCPMCQHPIDRTLPRTGRRHPLASVIDEWVPRNPCRNPRHGCDPTCPPGDVTPANCVEMHSCCNGIKHNHWPITPELRDRCTTTVQQHLTTPATTSRNW